MTDAGVKKNPYRPLVAARIADRAAEQNWNKLQREPFETHSEGVGGVQNQYLQPQNSGTRFAIRKLRHAHPHMPRFHTTSHRISTPDRESTDYPLEECHRGALEQPPRLGSGFERVEPLEHRAWIGLGLGVGVRL